MKHIIYALLFICTIQGFSQIDEGNYSTGNNSVYSNDFKKNYGEVFFNLIGATTVDEFPGVSSNNDGFGIGIGGVFNPFKKMNVIKVGIDFSYIHMGKNNNILDSIPLKTTLSIYPVNFIVRLRLPSSYLINPYIDLLAGVQYIETNTKYDNSIGDSFANVVLEENTKTLHATANSSPLTYGFGVGFSLRFLKSQVALLDLGFRYLNGSQADYVSPENIRVTKDGDFYYTTSKVNSTDMMYFHIGINGYF